MKALFDTMRHETAHRWLDVALGERIPRWLNEGLAEVFAACWNAEGAFEPGGMRTDALLFLYANKELTGVERFMTQEEEQFLAQVQLGYAQAWALVHFLRFGADTERTILDRLLAGLESGADPQLAIDEAIAGVDMEDVHERFRAWVELRLKELAGK
jgi:hypothetical protein